MNALRFDFNHFDYFQYDLLAHVLDNIPAMLQAAALDKFKDILQEQPVAVVAAEPTYQLKFFFEELGKFLPLLENKIPSVLQDLE